MQTPLALLGITASIAITSSMLRTEAGPFCDGPTTAQSIVASLGNHDEASIETQQRVPPGSERQCAAYGAGTPFYQRCRSGYVRRISVEPDGTQVLLSEDPLGPVPAT